MDNGEIKARVDIPGRNPAQSVILRLRHPKSAPIKTVTVNGKEWKRFHAGMETIELKGLAGSVVVTATYGDTGGRAAM